MNKQGGKRDGAGRKPGVNKIPYATKLSKWVVEWLRAQDNQAATIESALIKQYKLKPHNE